MHTLNSESIIPLLNGTRVARNTEAHVSKQGWMSCVWRHNPTLPYRINPQDRSSRNLGRLGRRVPMRCHFTNKSMDDTHHMYNLLRMQAATVRRATSYIQRVRGVEQRKPKRFESFGGVARMPSLADRNGKLTCGYHY